MWVSANGMQLRRPILEQHLESADLEWVFGVLIQSIPWFRYSENSRTIDCNMNIDYSIGNSSPVWLGCVLCFASTNSRLSDHLCVGE